MPKKLEKIRKDILKGNPKMSESMSYALATNILKKRKGVAVTRKKAKGKGKLSRASVMRHEKAKHGMKHEKSEGAGMMRAEKKMGIPS
jgi:hypothetical protein